jgi:hypothetical protein
VAKAARRSAGTREAGAREEGSEEEEAPFPWACQLRRQTHGCAATTAVRRVRCAPTPSAARRSPGERRRRRSNGRWTEEWIVVDVRESADGVGLVGGRRPHGDVGG